MPTLSQIGRLGVLTVAVLLTMTALPVGAQTLSEDEFASLLENAATKEEHLKLANHYTSQAKKLHKDSSRHEDMAERYKHLTPRTRVAARSMVKHCERLAASLSDAAKAADQLASAHHEMAEEAQ